MAENGLTPGRTIDLDHPDEIEIRRLQASSREDAEDIRAELEARGFTVIVRVRDTATAGPDDYHADIFAEKRTVPTAEDLAGRQTAAVKEKLRDRRDTRIIAIVLIAAAFLIGSFLLVLLAPLLAAIKKILIG